VENDGTLVVASSAVSGNSAYYNGGGVFNSGTATLTNSTVSGNSANFDGGGINNSGILTLTNSTVTGNYANNDGGGIDNNYSTLTLVQTMVSGNSAGSQGSEVHNNFSEGSGTVNADYFNLFGYDGSARVTGFTPGVIDIVPSVPLAAILDPTLGNNGGPTRTHALVTGSPAIDAVPDDLCVSDFDQRGIARPQDGDRDTVADCDIGAFEVAETPPGADLSLTSADSPDPVVVGQPLAYTLTVRNNGPDSATGVTVTDFLPNNVSLVSATPSQGSCSGPITVSCALGNLANGATATVTIAVRPAAAGALSNTASVTGSPNDPNPDDNSDTETTTVNPSPPANAAPVNPNPQLLCTGSTCRVPIKCDGVSGTSCNIAVKIFVPAKTLAVRFGDAPAARARGRLLFAAGVTNIPAGQIANVKLKLRKAGRQIASTSTRLRIRGRMEIRNSTGTVSSTPIRIRLKRR